METIINLMRMRMGCLLFTFGNICNIFFSKCQSISVFFSDRPWCDNRCVKSSKSFALECIGIFYFNASSVPRLVKMRGERQML